MGATQVRTHNVADGSINRDDLDITTAGKAVIRKIIQGTGVSISSTGADSGTGDVTINIGQSVGTGNSPTFAGLTLTGMASIGTAFTTMQNTNGIRLGTNASTQGVEWLGSTWSSGYGHRIRSYDASVRSTTQLILDVRNNSATWSTLAELDASRSMIIFYPTTALNINTGALQMGGTTVIDASRNLSTGNILPSTADSSTIGNGTSRFHSVGLGSSITTSTARSLPSASSIIGEVRAFQVVGSDGGLLRLSAGGGTGSYKSYIDLTGYSTDAPTSSSIFLGTNNVDRVRINSTGTNFITGVVQIGGTTVIDASRNLANIGTISSGAITSSGTIKTVQSLAGFVPVAAINTNTAQSAGFFIAETDNGLTPVYMLRFGSTHATHAEVFDITNQSTVGRTRFVSGRASGTSFEFYANGNTRVTIAADGALTLGTTAGTGSAALYSGSITSSSIIRGASFEINTNADFTINAYYSSGWKYRANGYAGDFYQTSAGDIVFLTAPSGTAGNAVTFTNRFTILNGGGIKIGGNTITETIAGYLTGGLTDTIIFNTNEGTHTVEINGGIVTSWNITI